MVAVLLLVCVSLLIATAFLLAFLWTVKNNQTDEDDIPLLRLLFDDRLPEEENDTHQQENQTHNPSYK